MAKNSNTNSKTSTTQVAPPPPTKNVNSKKNTKATNEQITDSTFFNSNTKTPSVVKTTGAGSNQTGKKRGSYNQNLWVLEFRDDKSDRYIPNSMDAYDSRDEARQQIDAIRGTVHYKKGDVRLAKYTFAAVDHS